MEEKTHTDTDEAILRIRAYIREKRFSNLHFAKITGVTEGTIRGIFKDNPDPRITTLRKMEAVIPRGYKP